MASVLTTAEIAELTDGRLIGNESKRIVGAAPFEAAGADQITFAGDAKFLKRLAETGAGAVLVPRPVEGATPCQVVVTNPQVAFVKILEHFHPQVRPAAGTDPRAVVGDNVQLGADVHIGPLAVIGSGTTIGNGVVVHPNVVVGEDVAIGDGCLLYPNVTIGRGCRIGRHVILHPGAVIGSDGFGFAPDGKRFHKIPHTGIVQIDDDVEVGANVTIDRATFGRTWIQRGVKIDNLVQVAHNVTVGEDSILVAQVGIAGSATIGHHVVLAGQAGISGHIKLGNRVTIGPQAGVGKSIADGEVISGSPGLPHRQWLRVQRTVSNLPELKRKLSELEKRVAALTADSEPR